MNQNYHKKQLKKLKAREKVKKGKFYTEAEAKFSVCKCITSF